MSPIYEMFQVPGQTSSRSTCVDAFVPGVGATRSRPLSGFMVAGSDPSHYGQLDGVPDAAASAHGPALVDADIAATPKIVKSDQPAQPERLHRAVRERADRAGRRLDALLPAVLRAVVAQPVSQARLLHRRLRVPMAEQVAFDSTLALALGDVFNAPVSSTPGAGRPGRLVPRCGPLPDRPCQDPVPTAPDRSEGGKLRRLQTDINTWQSDARAAPAADRWHGRRRPTTSTTTTTSPTRVAPARRPR